MIHRMKLTSKAFKSISSCCKTVEMRLNDEKRSAVSVGDKIEFESIETHKKIMCEVKSLNRFKDFFELYSHYDKLLIGYGEEEVADPRDMHSFYSPELIEKYGVLAIEIKLIS